MEEEQEKQEKGQHRGSEAGEKIEKQDESMSGIVFNNFFSLCH